MNTRELAEDIIEALFDGACEGDVADVFVVFRDSAGSFFTAAATDDMVALVDHARKALSDLEADPSGHCGMRLN